MSVLTLDDWGALALSLRLAAVTTLCLLILGTPLAWWLARTRSFLRPVLEVLVALPLVLPPTVLGFYLLLLLGGDGPMGRWFTWLELRPLAFSFHGLVVGSIIYSLPFVVQPLHNAFSAVDERLLEAAATMGAAPIDRFVSVVVPNSRAGFSTAAVLGFAHTLGEFGVVLMLGGNIPGSTRTASVAIYNHVEAMRYGAAHQLAVVLLLVAVALLIPIYVFGKQGRARK